MPTDATRLKLVLNTIILIVSLYGISQKNYISGEPSWFEKAIMDVFSPIQKSVYSITSSTQGLWKHYIYLVGVTKKNETLETGIDNLENEIFKLKEIREENKRLKELLEFGQEVKSKKVLAQVVGWDSSTQFSVLRINKGKKDGVFLRAPVVTAKGLVGYIYRTSRYYSDVLTILDQNNRVDALVSRIRSHGIVEGYSNNKCIMKYVTRTEPVVLNDVIVTSGLGRIYPKGIKIGVVSKIERESYGITQFVEVQPSVNMRKLEEVMVLTGSIEEATKEEWEELENFGEESE